MAKYMLEWEVDASRMPNAPQEIAMGWKMLAAMVKKDFDTGLLKDWGAYPGERCGYSVIEGSEMDVMKFTMQYAPFIAFKVHPVSSIGQVAEFLEMASK